MGLVSHDEIFRSFKVQKATALKLIDVLGDVIENKYHLVCSTYSQFIHRQKFVSKVKLEMSPESK